MEIVFDVFGVIGALATLAALGWGIYTWRHRRRPHVEVKVSNAWPTFGPNQELGDMDETWCFGIEVLNRGHDPLRVTSVGVELQGADDRANDRRAVQLQKPYPEALPGVIDPNDSGSTLMPCQDLAARGVDVHGEIVAVVETPLGRFRSKPRVLRDR